MIKEKYEFIFEIENLNIMLNDFDAIFKEKNKELQTVIDKNILESLKDKEIKNLLFKVVSYQNSLKTINKRYNTFKESDEFIFLNKPQRKLVKDFEKKLNKYLDESKYFIGKCLEILNSDKEINI